MIYRINNNVLLFKSSILQLNFLELSANVNVHVYVYVTTQRGAIKYARVIVCGLISSCFIISCTCM